VASGRPSTEEQPKVVLLPKKLRCEALFQATSVLKRPLAPLMAHVLFIIPRFQGMKAMRNCAKRP